MSTYTPIASITLASTASSVTFSGIPQTYTDLVLVSNIASNDASQTFVCRLNGDSGSNYSLTQLLGEGTGAVSQRESNQTRINISRGIGVGTTLGNMVVISNFQNYSNTTTNKTVLSRVSEATASFPGVSATVGLWRNTAAITSVEFFMANGTATFNSGSTFNLYGIANASITNVAKATGGDSVYTDGTYWYHIFRSSGTFTPTQALTADYLVVAGGGSGGAITNGGAGGGGAGGLRCTVTATGGGGSLESALSLTAQAYTVTVGAGGTVRANGSDSTFATITATGGGQGGSRDISGAINGAAGGSGGGGGGQDAGATGGAGTANQGYAGGSGGNGTNAGGGGGGAGAVGSARANTGASAGGAGGNGVATSISGTSTTYAGGGGGGSTGSPQNGGAGGSGGGGTGGGAQNSEVASNGTANTGGGGGGGSNGAGRASGNGGSGIVIVRYGI